MNIGYACTTLGVPGTEQTTCRMKNADENKLREIIANNLRALKNSVAYNSKYNIKLFRISSDLIPFGSSPVNTLNWKEVFADEFDAIGKMIKENGMRVSMHPGQYTVLNSPNAEVVKNAEWDLRYHTDVLEALGAGFEHKLILHVGGIYGDKEESVRRFLSRCDGLEERIKNRLVIENDEKCFSTEDVLSIAYKANLPVVYDNLHEEIFRGETVDHDRMIRECANTWKEKDGRQKIHYAQQEAGRKAGAHAKSIRSAEFMDFYRTVSSSDIDMMLEVKDKNLSAIKCIYLTNGAAASEMAREWNKYRYAVLERSPFYYQLNQLDMDEEMPPNVLRFYKNIEAAFELEISQNGFELAAHHLWDTYFSLISAEKQKLITALERFKEGSLSAGALKNLIHRAAEKYNRTDLLESYYFLY